MGVPEYIGCVAPLSEAVQPAVTPTPLIGRDMPPRPRLDARFLTAR